MYCLGLRPVKLFSVIRRNKEFATAEKEFTYFWPVPPKSESLNRQVATSLWGRSVALVAQTNCLHWESCDFLPDFEESGKHCSQRSVVSEHWRRPRHCYRLVHAVRRTLISLSLVVYRAYGIFVQQVWYSENYVNALKSPINTIPYSMHVCQQTSKLGFALQTYAW